LGNFDNGSPSCFWSVLTRSAYFSMAGWSFWAFAIKYAFHVFLRAAQVWPVLYDKSGSPGGTIGGLRIYG